MMHALPVPRIDGVLPARQPGHILIVNHLLPLVARQRLGHLGTL